MKKIKYKIIFKKPLLEYVGNGYSATLSGMYTPYNNPTGSAIYNNILKGYQSSSLSGFPFYQYNIVPLNNKLQPKQQMVNKKSSYTIGNKVEGIGLTDKLKHKGVIVSVKKGTNNLISYYVILDDKSLYQKIDPTTISMQKDI